MNKIKQTIMPTAMLAAFVFCALGFVPDKKLDDAMLETRAQNIIEQLRCFVCQGQPLNQSSARLAQDLRNLVRHQLAQGKSDREIFTFITQRYGEDVLLKPPLKASTILLWLAPFLFLAMMSFVFYLLFFRRKNGK